jgi:hypothetical protein
VRGDVDGVEEDVLEIDGAVGADDPDGVFDVAGIDRVAAFQQFVEFAEQLSGKRLLCMAAGNPKRIAVDQDSDAECLLNGADVRVVLPEQLGEIAMIVEVEFERVFGGWLRNGPA